MLLADQVALLLLDGRGGRRLSARAAGTVLAGALLSELVLLRRLGADPDTGVLRVRPGPALEPRLAAALAAVTDSGGDTARSVRALAAAAPWDDAVATLAKTGALRTEKRRRFLVLTSVRWFPRKGSVVGLQTRLRTALTAARKPARARAVDPATVSLAVLLAGTAALRWVVPDLPRGLDADDAAEVLAGARRLDPEFQGALEDLESAVSVRAGAWSSDGDSSDWASGDGGGHHHGGHHDGHHGGWDGGSDGGSDGGGGDGGGGGGGD
ncbi:GOLPH3/VPS74 family protein [Kineococcus rhizosphaerae]|uniref:Golgi phosphoprotein 3 GPP34 n=1 Tax=Kineococcus rhizosphaerae TaxID=559628 RepID=A0A2T0QZK2_9ACTN|nr:GPP34 family phosphoprotein [Kineococcus rhizosphaerae]PRY12112.1 Golgi phosphoprotein 3 GPP34 [Kineococcus rhizosphaerae]